MGESALSTVGTVTLFFESSAEFGLIFDRIGLCGSIAAVGAVAGGGAGGGRGGLSVEVLEKQLIHRFSIDGI